MFYRGLFPLIFGSGRPMVWALAGWLFSCWVQPPAPVAQAAHEFFSTLEAGLCGAVRALWRPAAQSVSNLTAKE